MCAINGIWSFKGKVDKTEFNSLRDLMKHRGPDGVGLYISEKENIALGHRRLSLIDLSVSGTQPMCNEDKTVWLTVNGEIYNYREIRKDLADKGHVFSSTSDSEVIIHGYEEWGTGILDKLKGMFAFCIYDHKKQIFFIARDRFGIKPLYYYHRNDIFIFASELKSIVGYHDFLKEVDPVSVCNYLTYRYVPSPNTIWKNTNKLPPAHYLIFKKDQNVEITEYWKLETKNEHYDQQYLIEKTNDLLSGSIKGHLESDVQIGSFLSGGYDSSAIVYYMSLLHYPTKTFSIGFDNWNLSEHNFADIVSEKFRTEHSFEILDRSSLDIIDELVNYYDEPIADISIVPTFFVSKMASEKVKAVLSGEGSDEIFAGYTWHQDFASKSYSWEKFNLLRNYFKGIEKYSLLDYANAMAMGFFDKKNLEDIIGNDFKSNIPQNPFWFYKQHFKPEIGNIKSFQYLDIKTFMGELVLSKIDRASMANSLEVRVPFLDHELVEFLFSLPEKDYAKKNVQKFMLYENIKKSMPKEILNRKKQGFVGPDSYYMNIEWYRENLKNSQIVSSGLINGDKLNELIWSNDHWRLWKLLILEKWYRRWV
jgi:asparagine synthase (glutamine-hydrolysing)